MASDAGLKDALHKLGVDDFSYDHYHVRKVLVRMTAKGCTEIVVYYHYRYPDVRPATWLRRMRFREKSETYSPKRKYWKRIGNVRVYQPKPISPIT